MTVGAAAGDERGVGGGGDLGHLAEQFHVRRAVVEVVVADQAAERLAAELAVLLLVELLEDGALVPGRALELLQGLAQLLLRDVHHPDLEHLVRFGVVHQVMQAAPGALQLLEVLVVQDLVDLLGQLAVDLGDHRLDGPRPRRPRSGRSAAAPVAASVLTADSTASLARSDLGLNSCCSSEANSLASIDLGLGLGCGCGLGSGLGHVTCPPPGSDSDCSSGFGAAARACRSAGSFSALAISSSAPALAVHVGQQVRELCARLQQLVQGIDLARHRGRGEVVHALEREVHAQVAFAGQGVRHLEGDPRLHGLHPVVEVVDVDLQHLAVGHRRAAARPACRTDPPGRPSRRGAGPSSPPRRAPRRTRSGPAAHGCGQ